MSYLFISMSQSRFSSFVDQSRDTVRAPLIFDLENEHFEGVAPEIRDAIINLKNTMDVSSRLFYWVYVPIEQQVPKSVFAEAKEVINLSALFAVRSSSIYSKAPSYSELDRLCFELDGYTRKKLTPGQQKELRQTGTFSVPSLAFPDQVIPIDSMMIM
jgi:hypothetical protein